MVTARQPDPHTSTQTQPVRLTQPERSTWSPALQTVLDQPAAALPRYLISAGLLFTGVFGAWAWLGTVDEVAKASGKLRPSGEVVKVNPSEMGRVSRVNVREGSTVRAGDVLFELDTELADKEVERLETILQSQFAQKLQLQSLVTQVKLEVQTKSAIAQTEIESQQAALSQQQTVIASRRVLISQLEADAQAQADRLERLRGFVEEGAIAREMLFQGESGLRDRQRSITETQGALQQTQAEVHRLNVGLAQKKVEAQQARLQAQHQVEQMQLQMTELQAKINETKVMLATAKASRKQRFIYSPASGTILTLVVKNRGEVLQPGQNIAEIAPKGIPLVLSTVLPNREVGFVKVGMPVKVKLDAYPYQDYGVIAGKVMSISPDTKPVEGIGEAYRLDVVLSQTSIKVRGQKSAFKPGQTATAEIITRQRRIIDVILDPIKKLKGGVSL